MADITVEIPGVGSVDFPDTMKPEEIDAAAKRLHEDANPKPSLGRQVGRAALNALPGVGAMVGGALSTPETLGAGTIPGIALGAGAGQGLRDLIGHYTGLDAPSSPNQKAMNIGKETAVSGATAALMPGIVTAIKSPVQTLREGAEQFGAAMPPWVRRLGKLMPALPEPTQGRIMTRPAWQTWPEGSAVAGEGSAAAPAAKAAPQAATGLSEAERAALVKQGYPSNVIARIEQQAAQVSTPVAAPSAPPPAPSALQGPRIRTGAERVGRLVGMTKDEVRQEAGPVLDETRGEASPILPEDALKNIIDKMKSLPRGGPEREAYVQAATSGKTKWQVENIRRTLEHLGFLAPPVALGGRAALLQLMRSHEPAATEN